MEGHVCNGLKLSNHLTNLMYLVVIRKDIVEKDMILKFY